MSAYAMTVDDFTLLPSHRPEYADPTHWPWNSIPDTGVACVVVGDSGVNGGGLRLARRSDGVTLVSGEHARSLLAAHPAISYSQECTELAIAEQRYFGRRESQMARDERRIGKAL